MIRAARSDSNAASSGNVPSASTGTERTTCPLSSRAWTVRRGRSPPSGSPSSTIRARRGPWLALWAICVSDTIQDATTPPKLGWSVFFNDRRGTYGIVQSGTGWFLDGISSEDKAMSWVLAYRLGSEEQLRRERLERDRILAAMPVHGRVS